MKANSSRSAAPVGDWSEDFLNPVFLRKAKKALDKSGFISDEHDFAPYGEALWKHRKKIQRELRKIGFGGHLAQGKVVNHPTAGYSYYLYDTDRFIDSSKAETSVSRWLDHKYPAEAPAQIR